MLEIDAPFSVKESCEPIMTSLSEKVERALANFFRESTLAALREMALRQAAYEVETRQGESPSSGLPNEAQNTPVSAIAADHSREKLLIHITPEPNTAMLAR
jgi:two-component system sensor histidine kinase KdpD